MGTRAASRSPTPFAWSLILLGLLRYGRQIFGFIGLRGESIHFGGSAADVSIAASFTNDSFLMMVAVNATANGGRAALDAIKFYVNAGMERHLDLNE
jgi:hypothetical protein